MSSRFVFRGFSFAYHGEREKKSLIICTAGGRNDPSLVCTYK
jgi:hypothetical protein